MQKITTHLWFDTEKDIKEATALYVSIFPKSNIDRTSVLTGTPSGDCNVINFTLAGQKFASINAGPYFKFNPSISMFVTFDDEIEIKKAWDALIEGGMALMPYQAYPWAKKYGWLQDKWGLTWQLSLSDDPNFKTKQRITPLLMFTQAMAGKAKEAIDDYTKIFPNSKLEIAVPYIKGEGDKEGYIKHARFVLNGQSFMAMDSSADHRFVFNEAISLMVSCDTQEEIDYYWDKLSAVPESEQCGWLKDKYGVSWQITPSAMDKMMAGSKEQIDRVTQAFLKMKKFDIAELERAYKGK